MNSNTPLASSRRRILAGDILRKGGAHGPSNKALRARSKRELRRADDYDGRG